MEDFLRPLNERGLKDAPIMAKILKNQDIKPDLIICSPSTRTKQTLEYFIKELDYKDEVVFEKSIYEAPFENLLKVIKNVDDKNKIVFLVGHNPSICHLTNYLVDENFENIPTCSIVEINFDTKEWEDISKKNSKLISFIYPKLYL